MQSTLKTNKKQNEKIEKELSQTVYTEFSNIFFTPIHNEFPTIQTIEAEQFQAIIDDIATGNIVYSMQNQSFKVKINSLILHRQLEKIGATYNGTRRSYEIAYELLSSEIQHMIATKENATKNFANTIEEIIKTGLPIFLAKKFSESLQDGFHKITELTNNTINKNLKVPPKKTTATSSIPTPQEEKLFFENEYTKYVNKIETYSKAFAEDEMKIFREKVAQIRLQGGSLEELRSLVNNKTNATKSRVDLIIRQETALANSSYEIERYARAGITKFKWVYTNIAKDPREHHQHWGELSKKGVLFDATNPPRNPETNEPEMPSEPFNCHCYAIFVREKD